VYSASTTFKTIGVQNYSLVAYQWVSILSGILTVFFLKKTGKILFTDRAMRLMFIIGIMSTAASQMFFSYVENYSIGILAVVIYIFCSVRYLKAGKHFFAVTLSFVVLVLSHYGMALIVPSYLYLLFKEFTGKRYREVILNLLLLSVIGIFLYVAVYNKYPLLFEDAFRANSHLLIHSVPGTLEYSYSFLSHLHIIDILNLMVFVSPFIVFMIPHLIRTVRFQARIRSDKSIFFALSSIAALLFVVGMKSDLGMSRDWDLFTLYLFPTVIASVIFVLKSSLPEHLLRQAMIIFGITLLHSAAWIAINTTHDISLQYITTLNNDVLWSKKANAHTMDELGSYFQQRGAYNRSLQFNLKYLEYDPANLRMIENVASTYFYVFSDDTKAQQWCEKAVNAGSKDWRIYNNLAEIKMKQQDYSSAMNLLKICISLNPQSTMPKLNLAFIIGTVKGKMEEASLLYEEVLQKEPENANALLNAGYLSYKLTSYEKTKLYLGRYLAILPNSPDSKNIQSLLRSLRN
jgi:Tfp pilus assembly protein PilF